MRLPYGLFGPRIKIFQLRLMNAQSAFECGTIAMCGELLIFDTNQQFATHMLLNVFAEPEMLPMK